MTSPRGADELVDGQAAPETTVNEIIRHTEAGACHFPVVDKDLTTPPGSCADGASYIIAATATGVWAGKETQIATALGTNAVNGWRYHEPVEGFTAYVQDENARYLFGGASWAIDTTGGTSYSDEQARDAVAAMIVEGSGLDAAYVDGSDTLTLTVDPSEIEATTSEVWTGTSQAKVITPKAMFDAAVPQTLTDASTIAVDMNAGINFTVTLTGDHTLGNPTNVKVGQSGVIYVVEDGSGGHSLTLAANWKPIGGAPAIDETAGAVNVFSYFARTPTALTLSYLGIEG